MQGQLFLLCLFVCSLVICSVLGQEELDIDEPVVSISKDNYEPHVDMECRDRLDLCNPMFQKYASEEHETSWAKRRKTPLQRQCRDLREMNSCIRNSMSASKGSCERTITVYHIQEQIKIFDGLYKFACVDEFNAIKDHLPCILSEAIEKISERCFQKHLRVQNCSSGAELYKCFEPALDATPECTKQDRPLLRKAFKTFVAILPGCSTGKPGEEEDESDETFKNKDEHDVTFEKEIVKDGVHIRITNNVNIHVAQPKDQKKKKTIKDLPYF
jgi:hypothetical protein